MSKETSNLKLKFGSIGTASGGGAQSGGLGMGRQVFVLDDEAEHLR